MDFFFFFNRLNISELLNATRTMSTTLPACSVAAGTANKYQPGGNKTDADFEGEIVFTILVFLQ